MYSTLFYNVLSVLNCYLWPGEDRGKTGGGDNVCYYNI